MFDSEVLAIDVETTGLDWTKEHIIGVGIASERESKYFDTRLYAISFIHDVLADLFKSGRKFIFHNGKFDLHFLQKDFGLNIPENVEDTMIMATLIDENSPHGLTSLSASLFGLDAIKNNVLVDEWMRKNKKASFSQMTMDLITEYCKEDAFNTLSLYFLLDKDIDDLNLREVYTMEKRLLKVLLQMESNGVLFDRQYLESFHIELINKTSALAAQLILDYALPSDFNIISPPQVSDFLFNQLGLEAVGKTKKGKASTKLEDLDKIKHPAAQKIAEYRHLMHTDSTFVLGLLELMDAEDKVHCNFRQLGAKTGRLSCVDPNLQQLPKFDMTIRRAVIGHQNIVSFDYSQMEMRLFAHFSQDRNLIKAFQSGIDVYASVASELFGIDLGQVNDLAPVGDNVSYRDFVKGLLLGLIYGMGINKFAYMMHLSVAEAAVLLGDLFNKYPGIKSYQQHIIDKVQQEGEVLTLLGRRRHLYSADSYKGVNCIAQGSAADIIKLVMCTLPDELVNKMLITVHDELLFRDLEEKEIGFIKKHMCNFNLLVPLVVNVQIGKNWGEMNEV